MGKLEDPRPKVGIVVIGRNEGERLRLCLQSVLRQGGRIVYIDSGSNDGSIALARSFGIAAVELDPAEPFTAARARNEGAAKILQRFKGVEFIQFVDGDCEMEEGWLATALAFLHANTDAAVVCGRRRERHIKASLFNRLCDMEWNTPCGETRSCGGDAMFRVAAFSKVRGFDPTLIAGEEPDLCFRLRQEGWKIFRLDAPMTIHDAAMFYPRQWWQRGKRSGYADMEAYVRRGHAESHLRRRVWSNYLWSLPISWPLWPLLWLRCFVKSGSLFATHIVLGKVPHALGQFEYRRRARGSGEVAIIEYK